MTAMPSYLPSSADDARSSEHDARKAEASPRVQGATPSESGNELHGSGADGVRVLVVDDHADMLSMMELLMARQRYVVETANSGRKALEIVVELCPQVIVSDIGMPDMDGLELMRRMRGDSRITPF